MAPSLIFFTTPSNLIKCQQKYILLLVPNEKLKNIKIKKIKLKKKTKENCLLEKPFIFAIKMKGFSILIVFYNG